MRPTTSYISVTDQFCGAGGSSWGAELAGCIIKLALNHWKLAIETHNSNFPNTDHDCTDISAADPRRYASTDILITSPECTNHSNAKGKMRKNVGYDQDIFGDAIIDPAEERSRATMWDVVRFAEYHNYRIIVVENVVEARHWALYDSWLRAMKALGYNHQAVYFNSMFAYPTPQSRDRMYVIFWKKGNKKPNFLVAPFIVEFWNNSKARDTVSPLATVEAQANHHGLVTPPFLTSYYNNSDPTEITDAIRTITTRDRHALVQPEESVNAEDCYFRMLQPHEIGRAMAFPDTYRVIGNSREKVKQYGNAVTPPVMRELIARCVESLL
jgi:site-specific DNA-cytosine methylase